MKTFIASTLGLAVLLSVGLILPGGASPEPGNRTPPSTWVEVRLLEQPSVTLQGTWLSHEEWEWPEETTTYDENGVFQSAEGIQIAEDVLVVDAASVRALFESGAATGLPVPDDCRIALHWKAADSTIWWQNPESSPSCSLQIFTPQDGSARLASTVTRTEDQRTLPAEIGRVLIEDSGHIEIGCLDHELGAASCAQDSGGQATAILMAEHENGDITFWVIVP